MRALRRGVEGGSSVETLIMAVCEGSIVPTKGVDRVECDVREEVEWPRKVCSEQSGSHFEPLNRRLE